MFPVYAIVWRVVVTSTSIAESSSIQFWLSFDASSLNDTGSLLEASFAVYHLHFEYVTRSTVFEVPRSIVKIHGIGILDQFPEQYLVDVLPSIIRLGYSLEAPTEFCPWIVHVTEVPFGHWNMLSLESRRSIRDSYMTFSLVVLILVMFILT